MRRIERIINANTISLLELAVYDNEDINDLISNKYEKNIIVGLDCLQHLSFFEELEYVVLTGGELNDEGFEFLYKVNPKALVIDYQNMDNDDLQIDLRRLRRLEYLFTRSQLNCINYKKCKELKTLVVFEWNDKDLMELIESNIDSLEIIGGKLCLLNGIEGMKGLKVLYLSCLRKLADISMINRSRSLRKLKMENCNKVSLTNMIENANLEFLMLMGNYSIESLDELRGLPNLKYFLLDNGMIEDGKLKCLKKLHHACIFQNRKNYDVKDKDLPKGVMPYMINEIPHWRQLCP